MGYDIVTDTRVALKVVRRSDAFHAQAAKELEILRALGGHAPAFDEGGDNAGGRAAAAAATEGHPNVVSMLDAFVHRGGNQSQSQSQSQNAAPSLDGGFRCLVFELLSHSSVRRAAVHVVQGCLAGSRTQVREADFLRVELFAIHRRGALRRQARKRPFSQRRSKRGEAHRLWQQLLRRGYPRFHVRTIAVLPGRGGYTGSAVRC